MERGPAEQRRMSSEIQYWIRAKRQLRLEQIDAVIRDALWNTDIQLR
jgi:hypothetical protein